MKPLKATVANRDEAKKDNYVVAMGLKEGVPCKVYEDGRREYIE